MIVPTLTEHIFIFLFRYITVGRPSVVVYQYTYIVVITYIVILDDIK